MANQHCLDLRLKTSISRYCYLEDELNETLYVLSCFNASFNNEFHDEILLASGRATHSDVLSQQSIALDIAMDGGMIEKNNTSTCASLESVRLARKMYKRLALALHPDKNGGHCEDFLLVEEAYRNLDTLKLFIIAKKKGLNIDGMYALGDELESSIVMMENKLTSIKHSIVWAWYIASEDNKPLIRKQIASTLVNVAGGLS